jgi:hypothetical protein
VDIYKLFGEPHNFYLHGRRVNTIGKHKSVLFHFQSRNVPEDVAMRFLRTVGKDLPD